MDHPPLAKGLLYIYTNPTRSKHSSTHRWVSFISPLRDYLWHTYFLPYIHSRHTIHLNIFVLITPPSIDFPFNFIPNITKCFERESNFLRPIRPHTPRMIVRSDGDIQKNKPFYFTRPTIINFLVYIFVSRCQNYIDRNTKNDITKEEAFFILWKL